MRSLLLLYRGREHGGWDAREHNYNVPTLVIGSHALHAAGYAMGIQRDGDDAASIAYIGDGAMSQGDVNEAMVFAASTGAPVVFLCTNNQ